MSHLRVAHLPRRHCPDGFPGGHVERRVREVGPRVGRTRACVRARRRSPGPAGAQPQPSKKCSEHSEGPAASQIAANDSTLSERADERTVDVRLRRGSSLAFPGVNGAAVEDGRVDHPLDQPVCLLGLLGRSAFRPVPEIAHTGSYAIARRLLLFSPRDDGLDRLDGWRSIGPPPVSPRGTLGLHSRRRTRWRSSPASSAPSSAQRGALIHLPKASLRSECARERPRRHRAP